MLDNRLKMIYDLMPGGVLCDIGTDHCKLACFAVEYGKCNSAIATDLRRGPLAAAKRLVTQKGLSDKVKLVLSNGFLDIDSADFERADCFVIAGMGGELIETILKGRHTEKPLILQPMSAEWELSLFLQQNGYRIEKRTFVCDGDKIYTAFLTRFDGKARIAHPFCACEKNDAFYKYIDREIKKCQTAIEGLNRSQNPDTKRLLAAQDKLAILLKEKNDESF